MHICTIVPNYLPGFGGAEIGTHMILSYLAQHTTHRISVITATTDTNLPRYENMNGVEVYRYYQPNLWLKLYAPIFFALKHVPALIKEIKPDLINMTYILPTGLAGWVIAKRRDIPIMMMLGGNDIYDPFNMPDRFLQIIAGYCIRRSNRLLAWSSWTANRLSTHFAVSKDEIQVNPFGIDSKKFNPEVDGRIIRERYKIEDDTILLFALQRLELRKGIDILIRAIKIVRDTVPDIPFKLLIAGKGRDREKLEQLVLQLNLIDYIQLLGFISEEEKAQHYAAADIFTFHSYHEGLGIVIQEASACALPIITTRAGGTLDVVKEGQTGFLTTPGDAQALGESIISLLKDPDRCKTMGQASAEFALSHFKIETISQKLLEIIETIH